MAKRSFGTLSLFLTAEILIGFGMFFLLPEKNIESADLNIALVEPMSVELFEEPASADTESASSVVQVVEPEPYVAPEPIVLPEVALTPQGQLLGPPEVIKAVYLTSWSGGTKSRIDYVIQLAKTTEMNAVVIDIKDFSGQLAYDTDVPEAAAYGAEVIKIWDIEGLLKRLHREGLYVIARVTVFQDPVLVVARPDLAVRSIYSGEVWVDNKGLGWIDPASQEAWNYAVAIARDASSRGFDEINFDYVRFPSDGNLQDMQFPFAGEQAVKRIVLNDFFKYLREHLQDTVISADLFGLATSSADDLGIGQVLEDALWHFDYVYPMVYPSHYANGYNGYANPAEYPYEVVWYSMTQAQARLQALKLANPEQKFAKLRPWLQDFDLGAVYDAIMVQAQAQATKDALAEHYTGFLLWAPTNWYTVQVLNPFMFNHAAYNTRFTTAALGQ